MSDGLVIQAKKPGVTEEKDENVTIQLNGMRLFGHGAYSNVYKSSLNENGQERHVAIKMCWEYESHVKEFRILRRLNAIEEKNIVKLFYVFSKTLGDKVCFSLVLGFMPTTLSAHISATRPEPLDIAETKIFAWQLFHGLNWMHTKGIFHRDVKPQNILVNPDTFLLQIGDFGSSVIIGEVDSYSPYQVTRYYRPPELLLGSRKYGPAIDIWSAGCVFAEMLRGQTFLQGTTTENQLEKVLECFGEPSETELQAMNIPKSRLLKKRIMVRAVKVFNTRGQNGLRTLLPSAPNGAIKLLAKVFNYSPMDRLQGKQLLSNSFFSDIFDSNRKRTLSNLLTKEEFMKIVAEFAPPDVKSDSLKSQLSESIKQTIEVPAEKPKGTCSIQ